MASPAKKSSALYSPEGIWPSLRLRTRGLGSRIFGQLDLNTGPGTRERRDQGTTGRASLMFAVFSVLERSEVWGRAMMHGAFAHECPFLGRGENARRHTRGYTQTQTRNNRPEYPLMAGASRRPERSETYQQKHASFLQGSEEGQRVTTRGVCLTGGQRRAGRCQRCSP